MKVSKKVSGVPLRRDKFIISRDLNKDNFRLRESWLTDELVQSHLDNEVLVGQFMATNKAGNSWTDKIILDLDQPGQQYQVMIEVMGEIGQEHPSALFRSSDSGHCYAFYLVDKNFQGNNIEILQTYFSIICKDREVQKIEVYPQKNHGVRLPFGAGGQWISTKTFQPIHNSKDDAIQELYSTWSDLPKIDRSVFIDKIYQLSTEISLSGQIDTKNSGIIFTSKSGKLWTREKQIREQGLTDYGQRNDAMLWLTAANFNRGLSLLESITNITDWSLQFENRAHSKDIQKAISTGNWKQIEKEVSSHYRRYERTYDPTKVSKPGKIDAVKSLSIPELKKAQELAVSITGSIKRKHRQKKSEYERILNAISFIWLQFQTYGWRSAKAEPVIRISKSLFSRARIYRRSKSKGFDPITRLIQAGLIEIHLKGYGNGLTPGRATVYKLNFSLLNLQSPKNIKPISRQREKREKAIVKQCTNNGQGEISGAKHIKRLNPANKDVSLTKQTVLSAKILSTLEKLSKNGDAKLKLRKKKREQ